MEKCVTASVSQQWMLCSEWVPSEWESDKNITRTPIHQLTSGEDNNSKIKVSWWIRFLQTCSVCLLKTWIAGLEWLWCFYQTLILTAPIHCRAFINETLMRCYISPNLMKKQIHLYLGWPEGEQVSFWLPLKPNPDLVLWALTEKKYFESNNFISITVIPTQRLIWIKPR